MKKQNESKTKRVFNLIIVDESGSMSIIRKQAFTGMNETLQTVRLMQKKFTDQEQYVTLVTFDSEHTKWHYDNTPAARTHNLEWKDYNPCGGTPLYDAMGKAISKMNALISDNDNVLVTVITDGEENCSEEWTLKMIRRMIEKLKKHHWTFTLIGTDNLDGSFICHRRTHGVSSGRGRNKGHVCPRATLPRTLQLLCCRRDEHACGQVL